MIDSRFRLTRFILRANVVVLCTILRFSRIQTGGWGSVERQSSASCFSFSVSQFFSSFFFSRFTVIIGKERGVWKTCFRVFAIRCRWMKNRSSFPLLQSLGPDDRGQRSKRRSPTLKSPAMNPNERLVLQSSEWLEVCVVRMKVH